MMALNRLPRKDCEIVEVKYLLSTLFALGSVMALTSSGNFTSKVYLASNGKRGTLRGAVRTDDGGVTKAPARLVGTKRTNQFPSFSVASFGTM